LKVLVEDFPIGPDDVAEKAEKLVMDAEHD